MCDFPIERPTVGNIEMAYHNLYWAVKDSIMEDGSICVNRMGRAKIYTECLADYLPKVVDDVHLLTTLMIDLKVMTREIEEENWETVRICLDFLGQDLETNLGIKS